VDVLALGLFNKMAAAICPIKECCTYLFEPNEFTALIKLTGPGGKLEKPLQKVAKLLLLLSENNSIVLYLAAVGTTNTPTMAAVYLVENYYKLTALSSHLH
jgi:hypothetical protein